MKEMILMKSFILSNFNLLPPCWYICSKSDINIMERIQKQGVPIVVDDYESDYETLLQKANMSTLELVELRLWPLRFSKRFI